MDTFSESDVETLESKLLSLELTPGEHTVLSGLIGLAEDASSEVTGFGTDAAGLRPDALSFLTTMGSVGTSVRPEDIVFASADGLGSTRVTGKYTGGVQGDET